MSLLIVYVCLTILKMVGLLCILYEDVLLPADDTFTQVILWTTIERKMTHYSYQLHYMCELQTCNIIQTISKSPKLQLSIAYQSMCSYE